MSDQQLQMALRAWESNPGDAHLASAARVAFRRAGQRLPPELLDRDVLPPREFKVPWAFEATALVPDPDEAGGRSGSLCHWTGARRFVVGRKAVELPAARFWWVRPKALGKQLPKVLDDLREHGASGLSVAKSRVDDAALVGLEALDSLRALVLVSCPGITTGVFGSLPPSLRYLDLLQCKWVKDRGWDGLARLLELTHLRTSGHMQGSTLPRICAAAPSLTHLDVRGLKVRNKDLEALRQCESLVDLGLASTGLSKAGIGQLRALPKLRRLNLASCIRMTPSAVVDLAKACPQLTHLDLTWIELNDAALEALSRLEGLRHVVLEMARGVTLQGLEALATAPSMRRIDLGGTGLEPPPPSLVEKAPHVVFGDFTGKGR